MTEEGYILSASEKMALREESNEIDNAIKEAESGAGVGTKRSVDVDYLRKRQKQLNTAIERGSPKEIRGGDKDRLANEAKDIEEQIREGMPTRDEMRRPEKYPGAVEKHMMWEKRNYQKIQRLKQLGRQLNPDDPTSGNIERLRRED